MRRSKTTYRASSLDMLRSGSRIVCGLGPADFGGLDRVVARLQRIASAGPAARLGLRVDTTSARWKYEPDLACIDVRAIAPVTRDGVERVLVELSRTASATVPFRARLAGEYLFLDLSHGFGDAVLPIEILAFLADPRTDPPLPAWAFGKIVANPLPRALAGWMFHNPRKVIDVLYGKLQRKRVESDPELTSRSERQDGKLQRKTVDAPTDTTPAERLPWTRSPSVVTASSPEGVPDAVRAWRSANLPGVSITAILSASIASALRVWDMPVDGSAAILFDCRRYLRSTETVLGNFAVGIEFDRIDPTSPAALHNATTHAIDNGRPLASGTLSAATYLRTRRAMPATHSDSVPAAPTPLMTFSDIGRVRKLESIAWSAETGDRSFFALSEPALAESIVITSTQVGNVFHVSASFHDNVFDAATVRSALELAMSDPLRLLTPQELPQ